MSSPRLLSTLYRTLAALSLAPLAPWAALAQSEGGIPATRLAAGGVAFACSPSAPTVNARSGPSSQGFDIVAELANRTPLLIVEDTLNPQGTHLWYRVRYFDATETVRTGFVYHALVTTDPHCSVNPPVVAAAAPMVLPPIGGPPSGALAPDHSALIQTAEANLARFRGKGSRCDPHPRFSWRFEQRDLDWFWDDVDDFYDCLNREREGDWQDFRAFVTDLGGEATRNGSQIQYSYPQNCARCVDLVEQYWSEYQWRADARNRSADAMSAHSRDVNDWVRAENARADAESWRFQTDSYGSGGFGGGGSYTPPPPPPQMFIVPGYR